MGTSYEKKRLSYVAEVNANSGTAKPVGALVQP